MESYVAPKANPVQKMASQLSVQIVVVIILLLLAGSIFISRNETIRNSIGIGPRTSMLSKSNVSRFGQTSSTEGLEAGVEEIREGQASVSEESAITPAANEAAPSADSTAAAADTEKPISVKIAVYEVAQDELQQIYENSRKNQLFMQFTDFAAGMANFKLKQWGENKKIKTLYTENKVIDFNNPIEVRFLSTNETVSPLGLIIGLNLREYRNNTYYGDLELIRLWKTGTESAPQDDRVSFPADIEMTQEMSFFVGGIIPHQNLKIVEEMLKTVDIFKGISSNEFKANMTDIIVAFEFEHSAPQK